MVELWSTVFDVKLGKTGHEGKWEASFKITLGELPVLFEIAHYPAGGSGKQPQICLMAKVDDETYQMMRDWTPVDLFLSSDCIDAPMDEKGGEQ